MVTIPKVIIHEFYTLTIRQEKVCTLPDRDLFSNTAERSIGNTKISGYVL